MKFWNDMIRWFFISLMTRKTKFFLDYTRLCAPLKVGHIVKMMGIPKKVVNRTRRNPLVGFRCCLVACLLWCWRSTTGPTTTAVHCALYYTAFTTCCVCAQLGWLCTALMHRTASASNQKLPAQMAETETEWHVVAEFGSLTPIFVNM